MDSAARPTGPPPVSGTDEPTTGEDAKLIAAILTRDRKATAEFVSRYADAVYAYVRLRLSPRIDLVDDLVQEVFLAAWEGLAGFRADASLQAWLLGITRHKVEDYYRSCLRQFESLDETDASSDHAAVSPELDELLDGERLASKTARVLATLPENYRLALVWRYWEKVPSREMAARAGKTLKAMERLLARAREQFKQEWQRE